jgi:hypothetical protein
MNELMINMLFLEVSWCYVSTAEFFKFVNLVFLRALCITEATSKVTGQKSARFDFC